MTDVNIKSILYNLYVYQIFLKRVPKYLRFNFFEILFV